MKKILLLLVITSIPFSYSFAQVFTNKVVGEKNEEVIDSIKKSEYPYLLPIWGKKVHEKGFTLPLSAGVNLNYLWQNSDIIISNLMVGFNNGPQYSLDEIVRFDDSQTEASSINLRPDIWVFPFLNVYGIFSKAKTSTAINAGVWLPVDEDNWQEVTTFSTKANFDATAFGIGITPTIGVAGGFFALDMNCAWVDVDALSKPAFSFVFGPRFGKGFNIGKRPDQTLTFWTGAFRLMIGSQTDGSLYLDELIPKDQLQAKVDQGLDKVDNAYEQVDTWWNGLTEREQNNPVNQAKYETANNALDAASGVLTNLDNALNDGDRASVQYSLQKKPKDMWNFILGTQYQLNKHFMLRGEVGFLGSRQQFIGGIQYRFGL